MKFLTKLCDLWCGAHKYAMRYVESKDFDVSKNCKPPRIIESD